MTAPIAPAQLDYAPAPRIRRKWIKGGVSLLILALIVGAAWQWGGVVWQRAELLYLQRRCLHYHAPADMVVYEEEPTAAAALIAGGGGYAAYPLTGEVKNGLEERLDAAAHAPTEWTAFLQHTTGLLRELIEQRVGWRPQPAMLLLHELRSNRGNRRLVCIAYPNASMLMRMRGDADASIAIIPATLTKLPEVRQRMSGEALSVETPVQHPNVRVYAGQIDPSDTSHFTIRYEMWGQSDVLDGRLNDDDSVTLTSRKPPKEPRGAARFACALAA